jgi:hypothetical protein
MRNWPLCWRIYLVIFVADLLAQIAATGRLIPFRYGFLATGGAALVVGSLTAYFRGDLSA